MSVLVNKDTRVICQGFTGKQGTFHSEQAIAYGTNMVGGVTPGKGGQVHLGLPVFNTVKQAVAEAGANASVIYVPAPFCKDSILEAIDAGIKLIVCITEGIPTLDMLQVKMVADSEGARIIGPNTLGLISPHRMKLGMAGGPVEDVKKAYMPGPVGIASRSGGMTTEIANLLTNDGIGQSTCVGVGGDPVVGSNFLDLIPLYDKDPDTKAIVIFCEPGGVIDRDVR